MSAVTALYVIHGYNVWCMWCQVRLVIYLACALCAVCTVSHVNACDNRYACESHVSGVYNHCSLCHKPVGWLVGGGHCGSFVLWACRRRYWTFVYLFFVNLCICVNVYLCDSCSCVFVQMWVCVFMFLCHPLTQWPCLAILSYFLALGNFYLDFQKKTESVYES